MRCILSSIAAAATVFCVGLTHPCSALAHCDTLDGPVVSDARLALETRDINSVLKWVKAEDEYEVRDAFHRALLVRKKGQESRLLADTYFFETVVRLHRASEGEPFTGLKPPGTEPAAAVEAADNALAKDSPEELVKLVTGKAGEGIRERLAEAAEKRRHKDESVEAGREYVRAYVEYLHYVERLYDDAAGEKPDVSHGEH